MPARVTSDDQLSLKSAIPGRERWMAKALLDQPQRSALVERALQQKPGIRSAQANPVTGGVLVLYDPEHTGTRVGELVRGAVERSLGPHEVLHIEPDRGAGEGPAAQDDTSPTNLWALAIGSLLVPPILLGKAALFLPALAGVGLFATTNAGIKSLRGKQSDLAAADETSEDVTVAELLAEDEDAHPLRRLLRYAAPQRGQIIKASIFSMLKKVTDLTPPVIIGLALDLVANGGSVILTALGISGATAQLLFLGATASVLYCVESYLEYSYKRLWRNLAQTLQHRLRVDTYAHVQRLELAHLEGEQTGELVAILNDNINQLEFFVNDGVDALLAVATSGALVLLIFTAISPALGLVALVPVPIILHRTFKYQKKIDRLYSDAEDRAGQLSSQLVNNISGIATIRSFTSEEFERERIRELSQSYVDSNQPAIQEYALFQPTIRFPVLVGFVGVLTVGGSLALAGSLSVGQLALVMFLIQRFLFPFSYLGEAVDLYKRTMAAVNRVFDLLATPLGPDTGDQPLLLEEVNGEIYFDDVAFAYGEKRPVLQGLTLRVPAGRTIAIVGPTGSGKTTIAKLLLRFYELNAGRILLDGKDVRDLRASDLRQAVGLVSQDVFLFDGTVRENIAYGSFEATFPEIVEAAQMAEADPFIRELPDGYDTLIGERGVKLSGGQRQRLCVARAILKDPPILILDEATSSVDNETEAAIQRSLGRFSAGRSTIVIAHRLSTVRHASCIYVLGDDGAIFEQGTHEELLRKGGLYASLWEVQTGGKEQRGHIRVVEPSLA